MHIGKRLLGATFAKSSIVIASSSLNFVPFRFLLYGKLL